MEAINLFLAGEFPHCVFVVALEPAVVAAHIEAVHKTLVDRLEKQAVGGWSALGWRFLEKIVQLPLSLPHPGPEDISAYVGSMFRLPPSDPSSSEAQGAPLSSASVSAEGLDDLPIDAVRGDEQKDDAVADEVSRLEDEGITVGSIPGVRRGVEDRLIAKGFSPDEAKRMSFSAISRLFTDVYSDSDPTIKSIITKEALSLPSRNPRDIKRLVNLFRFYAMIANERRALDYDSAEALETSFEKVARLCVLAIRWPDLLNLLGGRAVDEMELSTGPSDITVLEAIELDLHPVGWLKGRLRDDSRADELQGFLATSPKVGDIARLLL